MFIKQESGDTMPQYISAADIAKKWGITQRRVTTLCVAGRIPGAFLLSTNWAIPADAEKPADERIKSGKYVKPKNSPAKHNRMCTDTKIME